MALVDYPRFLEQPLANWLLVPTMSCSDWKHVISGWGRLYQKADVHHGIYETGLDRTALYCMEMLTIVFGYIKLATYWSPAVGDVSFRVSRNVIMKGKAVWAGNLLGTQRRQKLFSLDF